MSEVLGVAIDALKAKLPEGFAAKAKFVIEGEGAIIADTAGVRPAANGDGTGELAQVTLTASAETFRAMLAGEMNPTSAFMSGKLRIDGSMGLAMQLGQALS